VVTFKKSKKCGQEKYVWKWGDQPIDVADSYTYLGITMNANGKYQDARDNIKNKASKAMYAIMKYCKGGDVPAKVALELYEKLMRPILVYGSEIWMMSDTQRGGIYGDNTCSKKSIPGEKVALQYARYILGVHKKTSNLAVRGELGLYPLYIECIIQMCKYWHRAAFFPPESLIGAAYAEQIKLVKMNTQCWLKNVYMLLEYYNLHKCMDQPEFFDIGYLREKIISKYENYWHDLLYKDDVKNGSNKLRTYRLFKSEFKFEPYLNEVKIRKHRCDLTRLRTSSHKLNIEVGRYSRPPIPVENRICKVCNNSSIEDEYHIFNCDYYADLRSESNIEVNNREDFYKLMMNVDDAKSLSFYVHKCFDRRKESS
jgi:hypothetical protein